MSNSYCADDSDDINAASSGARQDWYDSDSATMIAPPPSLADTLDYDADDDCDTFSSAAGSGYNTSASVTAVGGSHASLHAISNCFSLLEAEMICVQQDIRELMICMQKLLQIGMEVEREYNDQLATMEHATDSEKMCPLTHDVRMSVSSTINWRHMGPFINDIISDLLRLKELNECTNNVIRRLRAITKINETDVLTFHAPCKNVAEGEKAPSPEFSMGDFVRTIPQFDHVEENDDDPTEAPAYSSETDWDLGDS